MYFSATIFSLVGFRSPILTSLSIASTNFLFTLVAFHYIDRVGRRRILLLSIPVMVAGLALCAVAFTFLKMPMEATHQRIASVSEDKSRWPLVILAAMVVYVAGYAVGLGNVPWQQSEYVSPFSFFFDCFLLPSSKLSHAKYTHYLSFPAFPDSSRSPSARSAPASRPPPTGAPTRSSVSLSCP